MSAQTIDLARFEPHNRPFARFGSRIDSLLNCSSIVCLAITGRSKITDVKDPLPSAVMLSSMAGNVELYNHRESPNTQPWFTQTNHSSRILMSSRTF